MGAYLVTIMATATVLGTGLGVSAAAKVWPLACVFGLILAGLFVLAWFLARDFDAHAEIFWNDEKPLPPADITQAREGRNL